MSLFSRHSLIDPSDLFDHFYAPVSSEKPTSSFFSPRVDIVEKDGHYEINADLPGVKKDDLSVTLKDGVLTLEASTNDENTVEEDGRVIRKERRSGKFLRSFTLGNNIQEADVSASFNDGVLTLKVPKQKEVPPETKKIAIQ